MVLLDPQIAGRYEILDKIREGGMGAIYRVRHRLLDEERVVKVIRAAHPTEEAGARFLHEARAAIRLRHPNVAVLHDFAVAPDGNALIVMELIQGWSLLELLRGYGPPPLPLTLEIARQALKALGYLHRNRFVHRDISPDNLMLTRDVDGQPLVKLIDLGIAKTLAAQTGQAGGITIEGAFLGKPRYAAPEQFGSEGTSGQSDLYSFAVVLYELLTGEPPVRGTDLASYMAGHLILPPVPFEDSDPQGHVPDDLRAVVCGALAKKPAERPADAAAFAQALAGVQDRYPLARVDFEEVLAALRPPSSAVGGPRMPGSTAEHIDRRFGRTTERGVPELAPAPDLPLVRDESTRRVRVVPAETLTWRPPILDGVPPAAGFVGFVGFDSEPEPEPAADLPLAQLPEPGPDAPLEPAPVPPLEPDPAPVVEPSAAHGSKPPSEPDAEEWPVRPAPAWQSWADGSRWPIGFARMDDAAAEASPAASPEAASAEELVTEAEPSPAAAAEEPPAVLSGEPTPEPAPVLAAEAASIPMAAVAAPEEAAWASRALREPEHATAVSVAFEPSGGSVPGERPGRPGRPSRPDQQRSALAAAAVILLLIAGGASWQVAGRASARPARPAPENLAAAAPEPAVPERREAPPLTPAPAAAELPSPLPVTDPAGVSGPGTGASGASEDTAPDDIDGAALSAPEASGRPSGTSLPQGSPASPPPPAEPAEPAEIEVEDPESNSAAPSGARTSTDRRTAARRETGPAAEPPRPRPASRPASSASSSRRSTPRAAAAPAYSERSSPLSASPGSRPATSGRASEPRRERTTFPERAERPATPRPTRASHPVATYTIPFDDAPPPSRPTSRSISGPARRGDFFLAGRDVSSPVPLAIPSYRYPAAGRGSGWVSVRVALLVDEHGGVMEVAIREGGPAGRGFDEAALAAARRTRFQPAYRGNVAGKMWTELIFDFVE